MIKGKIILYYRGVSLAVELYNSKAFRDAIILNWTAERKLPAEGYSIGIIPMTINNTNLEPETVGYNFKYRHAQTLFTH